VAPRLNLRLSGATDPDGDRQDTGRGEPPRFRQAERRYGCYRRAAVQQPAVIPIRQRPRAGSRHTGRAAEALMMTSPNDLEHLNSEHLNSEHLNSEHLNSLYGASEDPWHMRSG